MLDLTEYEIRYLKTLMVKSPYQTTTGEALNKEIMVKLDEELEQIELLRAEI